MLLATALPLAVCTLPMAAQTAGSTTDINAAALSRAQYSPSQALLAEAAPGGSGATNDGAAAPAAPAQDAAPAASKPILPADIYNGGFYVESKDKSFSLYVNG